MSKGHNRIRHSAFALLASAMLVAPPLVAQHAEPDIIIVEQEEDEQSLSDVIVTGSRIRQGGAQDIQHFRSMALSADTLPRPESLSVEGLMGEHDLTLPAGASCDKLFCLNVPSMAAYLPTRPDDHLFVGLGFDSNIDGDAWQREPVSVMAVVDRSGSMSGPPIENVKAALHALVDQLGPQDRLGIAIYGTTSLVHLAPTAVAGNKDALHASIDAIAIDGSTNMEAGLKIGIDAALAEAAQYRGKTRLMLFTDEQPNTGRTDALGFMGLAETASRAGIGMTTIGVGVQYDGALATKISSVRGGNLFFITGPAKGRELMEKEFRNMVSEVAHDLVMTLTPQPGYKISGVFGVPDGLMKEGRDGSIALTVPTVFLSSNGGGIFASLAKADTRTYLPPAALDPATALMTVSLSYTSALDGAKGSDAVAVGVPQGDAPAKLRLAQSLVDQYLTMDMATRAYHEKGDAKAAFAALDGLSKRLAVADFADLKAERELVDTMRGKAALYAGYSGEVPKELSPQRVLGKWRVVSLSGVEDLSKGDVMEFTAEEEVITYFQRPLRGDDELYQEFQINEREIYIPEGNLRVLYSVDGDRLRLHSRDDQVRIVLARAAES